jgi:ATP-dependent helicase/nuclease subunit A
VVVQGVADLVVVLPNELWLLDFKTDQVTPKEIAARAKEYEAQLQVYAAALSRIYRRDVAECWLYFLACREAVPIATGNRKPRTRIPESKLSRSGQLCLPLGFS